MNDQSEATLIIEVSLQAKLAYRFQSLLEAEEGLAVMRCFDPEHKKQQLWTTPLQRADLLEWLSDLPELFECHVLAEWYWADAQDGRQSLMKK